MTGSFSSAQYQQATALVITAVALETLEDIRLWKCFGLRTQSAVVTASSTSVKKAGKVSFILPLTQLEDGKV